MLVALSAILLSICGLFIAIYEASLIRQSQKASVWPHVQVGVSMMQEGITLHVQNSGVGPARILAGAVWYKGEIQKDWNDLLGNILGEKSGSVGFNLSLINGTVFPVSSEPKTIFELTMDGNGADPEVIDQLRQAILSGEVDVTVCYSSVFDECWTSSLQDVLGRTRGVEPAGDSGEVRSCESAQHSGI